MTSAILLPAIACATLGFLSILALAALMNQHDWLASRAERWLAASTVFVVALNLLFAALSMLPVSKPLAWLALPAHLLVVLGLSWIVGLRFLLLELRALPRAAVLLGRSLGLWGTVFAVALCGILGIYGLFGLITVPHGWDELAYHAPQALGFVQEGRLRSFAAPPDWILTYPVGAAVLWGWTMLFTGNDLLFRLPQMGFGLQLVLGTALLARRSGVEPRIALLVGGIVAAMPIFFRLSTTIGADLGYNAAIILALAFLAPPLRSDGQTVDRHRTQDLAIAVVAISQAVLIKIPVTAGIAFVLALLGFLLVRVGWRSAPSFLSRLARQPLAWALLSLPLVCGWTYWLNWLQYGSPFYPLALRIGGRLIFDGPLPPIEDIVMGHSTFGRVADMGTFQRWHAVFADWFQPINEDAFGGPGPTFLTFVLFCAATALLEAARRRQAWPLVLGAFCLVTLAIPASHLPRYSLAFLCVLATLAGLALAVMVRAMPASAIVAGTVILLSFVAPLRQVQASKTWLTGIASPASLWQDRGRSVFEVVAGDPNLVPAPEMLRAIRNTVGDGETIAYSTSHFAALMWNRNFSNRAVHVPARLAEDWLASIAALRPEVVLVATESGLATVLIRHDPVYRVVHSDPMTGRAEADRHGITLLRR
jgi:hypothetical protein